MSIKDIFNEIVEFYRKYGNLIPFDSVSDMKFEIILDPAVISDINLLQESTTSKNGSIIETITIGKTVLQAKNFSFLSNYVGSKASFKFEPIDFPGNHNLFFSMSKFLDECKCEKPEKFYIAEINAYSLDKNMLQLKTYESIIKLISIFSSEKKKACDYANKDMLSNTYKFVFLGESRIEFSCIYGGKEISIDHNKIDSFIADIDTEEGEIKTHLKERRQILKKSIIDLLKPVTKDEEKFAFLLHHIEELHRSYNNGMDLYLNEFSFSKFISDLSEKKISFIEKINKVVSDVGLKILLLPLIGVISKIVEKPEQIKIGTTLSIYSALMILLVFYTVDFLNQIREEIQNTFHHKKYNKSIVFTGNIDNELKKAYQQLSFRITVIQLVLFVIYIALLYPLFNFFVGDNFLMPLHGKFIQLDNYFYDIAINSALFSFFSMLVYLLVIGLIFKPIIKKLTKYS